ncbi:UNVERIFIED_CONTAM: hypothetical protein GTU68_021915 [Idotea baltica]|nr:hypothetical protein [Idotea baltica]
MKTSYLDYAMSVIVSRAIPDLRDGLKPVHRRILYAMHKNGYTHNKSYRKAAKSVGDVMGSFHPHGDSAIYDALVRMAQDFSMSLPLIDGQGNFGSMDGDNAAAMRYTEARLDKPTEYLLEDIDKDTVNFQDNYDGKEREPTVLPARYPNMLVNGAGGIAVGMATNIPPHNLGEVIDATLALIEDPDMDSARLMQFVPAPDFPTGGIILGRTGAAKAYTEGRGSVIIRAKTRVEEIRKDRYAIVVDEIPYQVNKATMIEKIAELSRDKKIEGIAHVQDESDRVGVRVVVELKRDATAEVVLNQLFRFTPLQTSFGCNMLALNGGRPEQLTLFKFLDYFISFREEVVARRTAFELRKARERSHILCGLAVAVTNVDEIVQTIRSSNDPAEAREKLMTRRWPAQVQARAILELRLQRLTAIGVQEVTDELQELSGKIQDYLDILRSRERIMAIISDELREVKEKFAVPRRTEIVDWSGDMDDEDLIEKEDMVVTITNGGYIKRTNLAEFRAQARGGKGLQGMSTKDDDFVSNMFVANTHTALLFFTTDGMVYTLKTWRLPLAGRNAKGKAIVNLLPIQQGVSIAALMPIDVPEDEWGNMHIVFATSDGGVRRNALSDFTNVKANGKIAMKLSEGVSIVNVRIATESDDFLLTTALGKAIRFPITDVRVFKGRDSSGVRGIRLAEGDNVVSMAVIRHVDATAEDSGEVSGDAGDLSTERYDELAAMEDWILTITAGGFGKRSSAHEYRVSGRGGMGVAAANLSRRDDKIVAAFTVEEEDQIMLATSTGQSIRCPVSGISRQGRSSSGVTVFNTKDANTFFCRLYRRNSRRDVMMVTHRNANRNRSIVRGITPDDCRQFVNSMCPKPPLF